MGPFQFETYHNPYVQSISQLMLAPAQAQAQAATTIGEAQARAAQQQGQAWAGAFQNIGQTVAALPQQIARVKQEGTINQLNELKLKEQQSAIADHDKFKSILKDTPQIQEGGMYLWDLPTLGQRSVAAGIDPAPYLAEFGKVNDAFRSEASARQATVQTAAQALAKAPDPDLALNFIDMASRNKTIDGQTAEHLKGMIDAAETPQAKAAVVQKIAITYAGQQKPLILAGAQRPGGAPQTAIDPLTNQVIATGASAGPAQPTPSSIAMDAAGGDPVQANQLLHPQPQQPPAQTHNMRLTVDGKTRDVPVDYVPNRDGSGGKWMYQGQDVTGKVDVIPAPSVTIRNEQNAPIDLPAWATDDSRPTGPDANVLDQKAKMTPNGLYQAALNYIATGQFPTTGRGSDIVSVKQRAAITSKVGAIAAASGMDEPALRAFYKANGASLAAQQKMFDNAQSNISTADRNVAELDKFLDKLPDTGSPLFNKPLRAFAKDVYGDPNMGPIATYLASVQNEYGKIITSSTSGSSVLTDSARHEAQQLVDPNATVAQMLGSIQALKTEGGNRLLSVGEQIQRIQQRIQAGPQGNNPPSSTAPVERWERVNGVMKKVGG